MRSRVSALVVLFGVAVAAAVPAAGAFAPGHSPAQLALPAADAPAGQTWAAAAGPADPLGFRPTLSGFAGLAPRRDAPPAAAERSVPPAASAPLARWTLSHATSTSLP